MQGTSDSKLTNKTEFMRYLDANPEAIPALKSRYTEYHVNFAKGSRFGDWLRQKYLSIFVQFYKSWWLQHPELYGKVYQQQESLSV
jgi:hypothetical protein